MLTILLLAASQTAQATEFDPFTLLGQARADFGDKSLPRGRSNEDREIWTVHKMPGHSCATLMLFPEGAYDRRFFLQPTIVDFKPSSQAGVLEAVMGYWLVYMTKTGPEVSQGIVFRWKLRLSNDVPDEMPSDLGTLEMMLYRRGLRVPEPVPKEAWHSLKARKGFAAYKNAPGPGFGSFSYWYVRPDRTSTGRVRAHDDLLFAAAAHTPFPYPITREERAALNKQGWKYRPPLENGDGHFLTRRNVLLAELEDS